MAKEISIRTLKISFWLGFIIIIFSLWQFLTNARFIGGMIIVHVNPIFFVPIIFGAMGVAGSSLMQLRERGARFIKKSIKS